MYIKNKRIDSLIGSILEDIIKEKPDNSIAHAIEYLCRKFPEETKICLSNFTATANGVR